MLSRAHWRIAMQSSAAVSCFRHVIPTALPLLPTGPHSPTHGHLHHTNPASCGAHLPSPPHLLELHCWLLTFTVEFLHVTHATLLLSPTGLCMVFSLTRRRSGPTALVSRGHGLQMLSMQPVGMSVMHHRHWLRFTHWFRNRSGSTTPFDHQPDMNPLRFLRNNSSSRTWPAMKPFLFCV